MAIHVHKSVQAVKFTSQDPPPTEESKAQEMAIRGLIHKINHLQACVASLFESVERHNKAIEILADDNPHLHLPRLTFAPSSSNPFPKEGIRSETSCPSMDPLFDFDDED
jgi:hypothetical protein